MSEPNGKWQTLNDSDKDSHFYETNIDKLCKERKHVPDSLSGES